PFVASRAIVPRPHVDDWGASRTRGERVPLTTGGAGAHGPEGPSRAPSIRARFRGSGKRLGLPRTGEERWGRSGEERWRRAAPAAATPLPVPCWRSSRGAPLPVTQI